MVRKTTLLFWVVFLASSLAGGFAGEVHGQGPSSYGDNMVFSWDYPTDAPPVDTWNIRIQRRFGDEVTIEAVVGWLEQSYEVIEIEYGVRISISVQGVNAAGTGSWSQWSEEHFREYDEPDLPGG